MLKPAPRIAAFSEASDRESAEEVASLFQNLLRQAEEKEPFRISFDDLSGVTFDIPDLNLSGDANRFHTCRFCRFAKRDRQGLTACMANKDAGTWLVMRHHRGFHGQCHLGLTDLVEPLIDRGRVLGVFYAGSIVLEGTEAAGRKRIEKYCARRAIRAAPFLRLFEEAPRMTRTQFRKLQGLVRTLVDLALRLVEVSGIPPERFRTELNFGTVEVRHQSHPQIAAAQRYIQRNFHRPVRLSEVARQVRCHPTYLCRSFKRAMGVGFAEYLMRVRVDHARNLIAHHRYSASETAFMVGFQNASHFGRVFRRLTGKTPGEYGAKGPHPAPPQPRIP